ncbi:undecaprenyl-phosphate glucose phosphotransferase [Chitiniphilus shinanonensis]|uniref:Undecaprenyl-phosphate glucose phosphotransferase n=1 Tax=Chitiniphilus shinanonensis TaxID=553088 RepID=A0ABQ6BTW9_9NEIS|nr:undecaprenyl-phosphate glucose phosphotransferase [Chitiniphilus shinanonensis]GLS04625.1 undecaprenyl-phosphate glucose phosphotransferase [Chitiniphilus shinanonensis]
MNANVDFVLSHQAEPQRGPEFIQSTLSNERFGQLAHAAPLASFCKSFLDPIVVVAVLYLLAIPFEIAWNGYLLVWAALAFLLSAQLLDGTFLFVPGVSRPLMGLGRFVAGWGCVVGFLWLIGRLSGFNAYFYPPFLITWHLVAPVVLIGIHVLFRAALLHPSNTPLARAVVIGANQAGIALANRIRENPQLRLEFAGYFDDRSASRLDGIHSDELLGKLAALVEYVKTHNIGHIYVSLPMTSQPRVLSLLEDLKDSTASIYFLPDFFVCDLIQARFDHVGGIPVVAVCESPFVGMSGVVKRVSDIVLALVILALIWPVMLAVALAVKFTSPGPVLFKQRRYGANGESILVYKFRSMTVMEDGDKVVQAQKNDQRLTPIGGFIRRTSLDELPQFINVLEGKMSIVGPRPHANAHNEMYRKLIRGYMIRHKVKPGITGWAQVNGYRGETDTIDKMQKRIEYDLDYLRNWSLWLDLKIVLQTATSMARDQNAY